MGSPCFPSTEQGWAGPKNSGLQGLRAGSPRCLRLRPWGRRWEECFEGLRGSRCVRAPGARNPARDSSPGRSRPRGESEDPVWLQLGARCPRRVQAPSAGAGGPMVSAGGGAGAPGGRVGTGRTPGPAAPRRARRPRGRPRHRRRRLAAPASRQRSRRGADGGGGMGRGGGAPRCHVTARSAL